MYIWVIVIGKGPMPESKRSLEFGDTAIQADLDIYRFGIRICMKLGCRLWDRRGVPSLD